MAKTCHCLPMVNDQMAEACARQAKSMKSWTPGMGQVLADMGEYRSALALAVARMMAEGDLARWQAGASAEEAKAACRRAQEEAAPVAMAWIVILELVQLQRKQ